MNSKKAKQLRKEVLKAAAADPRIKIETSYKRVKKLYTQGKIKIDGD